MAIGPQKVQIRRTLTPDNPPVGLAPGELSVEMANPLRLWVGVPAALDPSERKMLVPQSGVITSDTPPPAPIPNQLWWESDNGILWLWYTDANSAQWVQVSSGGTDVPDVPTDADEIIFAPGGGLVANDVQEAIMELDAEKVAKNGDTMTGPLVLSGAPTADLHAATKLYADSKGAASAITFVPTGTVAATNVQTAIVELDTEKIPDAPSNGNTYGRKDGVWVVTAAAGGGPVANAVDIAFVPTGTIAATNVQAALVEVAAEKLALTGGTMTGHITLPITPAAANAVRKDYVDTAITPKADKTYVDAQLALKLNLTGGALSGLLTISGNAGATITGNVTTYGWGGNNGVGVIFLNAAQNRYLIYDGASYSMPGASLSTVNGRLWGTNDGTPLWNTGGTITGGVTVNGLLRANNIVEAYGNSPAISLLATVGSPSWAMNVGSDGVWRMGTNNGAGQVSTAHLELHVDTSWWLGTIASTCYKVGGGPWADGSDGRIKNVTGNYAHGLAELLTLNPVRFTYKGNDTRKPPSPEDDAVEMTENKLREAGSLAAPYKNSSHYTVATTGQEFIGLIAQDAETALPEIVTKRAGYIDGVAVTDMRDVDTGPLIFALINAVKTLAARVEALEKR